MAQLKFVSKSNILPPNKVVCISDLKFIKDFKFEEVWKPEYFCLNPYKSSAISVTGYYGTERGHAFCIYDYSLIAKYHSTANGLCYDCGVFSLKNDAIEELIQNRYLIPLKEILTIQALIKEIKDC